MFETSNPPHGKHVLKMLLTMYSNTFSLFNKNKEPDKKPEVLQKTKVREEEKKEKKERDSLLKQSSDMLIVES
jgi:hypothetical protein